MSHWQNVIKKASSLVREHKLLEQEDRLIVAVSGGPDSTLLMEWLGHLKKDLRLECHLAHVNYRRRGPDSDADELFVKEQANNHGWSCDVLRPKTFTDDQGNFQAWAREQRYQFFAQLATRYQSTKLVVGHHLSDQIETMLLRLLRGSSLRGLAAMRPRATLFGMTVVRPFLKLTREEIEAALTEQGWSYRIDASNDSKDYVRNRLRQEVLPLFQECHPGYEGGVGDSLSLLQTDEDYLEELTEQAYESLLLERWEGITLARGLFGKLPQSLRFRVLRRAIAQLTGTHQTITFHHIVKMEQLAGSGSKEAHYDLPGRLSFEAGPLVLTLREKQ